MICTNSIEYLVYRYYRQFRSNGHRIETIRKALDLHNFDDYCHYENMYQREINGEPVGICNTSHGVAVMEAGREML